MERHTEGLVGKLWKINDPTTVRIGDCFLKGRLKTGDLFLCIKHSGDCFQTYVYIESHYNCWKPKMEYSFGSYGIGDATELVAYNIIIYTLIK